MEFMEIMVNYVLPYIPTIVSLLSVVVVVLKATAAFKDLKQDVSDANNVKELLVQNKQLMEDNREIKAQVKNLTQQITRIKEK